MSDTSVAFSRSMNLASVVPGLGQVIGAATVASNIGKVAVRCAALPVGYCLARGYHNDTNLPQPKTAKYKAFHENNKEALRLNLIYVGIGVIRAAIPVIGGALLYRTNSTPTTEKIYSTTNDIVRIQVIPPHSALQTEKYNLRQANHLILALPVIGQVWGSALLLNQASIVIGSTLLFSATFTFVYVINPCFEYIIDPTLNFFIDELLIPAVNLLPGYPMRKGRHEQLYMSSGTKDYLYCSMRNDLLNIKYQSAEIAITLTAVALPVIGGLTLYACGTHFEQTHKWDTSYHQGPKLKRII